MKRCNWANEQNERYLEYHDTEWGVPVTDDRTLFEFLVLEGAQAGLSWETILNKRPAYRDAFANFDPAKVALFTDEHVLKLMHNPGIVKNRLKIQSAVNNARHVLEIQREFGSLATFLWQYVDFKPIPNTFTSSAEVPAETALSAEISRDLKKRDFTFVGPTIMYAFMQAVGMVNDHTTECFRHDMIPDDLISV